MSALSFVKGLALEPPNGALLRRVPDAVRLQVLRGPVSAGEVCVSRASTGRDLTSSVNSTLARPELVADENPPVLK
eukprot:CAMPEP_0114680042 /NCGR_PEP_ID=MMETSP0191-20121206/53622_1 /TAXON_ID=126664 /ORGANISM="Sorites sp." /LENGTH=75 /DNA_ID=CAMNT_0001956209 /DNA_START=26 /DNA_END=253 /DNA_ORIENTATION=+